MAPPGTHHLGGVPQRPVGADPVPVAALADRERLGRLQQPAADRLLHHGLHRRPLALITGLGMSPALSTRFKRISRIFSIQTARSLHFLVLTWFVAFIVMHVTFVFSTGALVNLNHAYAGRNDHSWIGFSVFAASMVVVVVGWVAATPFTIAHPRVVQRVGQGIVGPLQHLFEHVDPTRASTPRPTSPRTSGTTASTPTPTSTSDCSTPTSPTTGCGSTAWSTTPSNSTSPSYARCPITSRSPSTSASRAGRASPKWGGVSMQTIMDLVKPKPDAKWVVFYSLGDGADEGAYYDAHPIEQMSYHLTMLAYDMNGEPLSFGHGAPLRLRNETQLGFKQVKWIKGVEFVAHFSEVGGGYGGYNQDHEFFGYRQSIMTR